MNITCILLNLNRSELAIQTIRQNLFNAGYSAKVYLIDNGSRSDEYQKVLGSFPFSRAFHVEHNLGVSGGLNLGIHLAMQDGADAVVTLANDILMPDGWLLHMARYATAIPETGTVGIHCVESIGEKSMMHGLEVQRWPVAFGNVLIPRGVIEKIGYYNTDFDPYGTQDHDFAMRAEKEGFVHYYIPGLKSTHIGHDVGNGTEYRKMKDESLQRAHLKGLQWSQWYEKNGVYLPYDQEEIILNKQQYYGEA